MSPITDNPILSPDYSKKPAKELKNQFVQHNKPRQPEATDNPNIPKITPIIKSGYANKEGDEVPVSMRRESFVRPEENQDNAKQQSETEGAETKEKTAEGAKEGEKSQSAPSEASSPEFKGKNSDSDREEPKKEAKREIKKEKELPKKAEEKETIEKPKEEKKELVPSVFGTKTYVKKGFLKYSLWKKDDLRRMTKLGRNERSDLVNQLFPDRNFIRKEDVQKTIRGIEKGRIKPPTSLGAGRIGRARAASVLRGILGEKPRRF